MPPILITSGHDDPQAVGADDARAAQARQLDHLGDVAAGDALGDDHDSLTPFSIASNTASLVKAGGTVTTEP